MPFQLLFQDFAAHADKIPPYVYQLAKASAKSNMAVCTILGSVQSLRLLSSARIYEAFRSHSERIFT